MMDTLKQPLTPNDDKDIAIGIMSRLRNNGHRELPFSLKGIVEARKLVLKVYDIEEEDLMAWWLQSGKNLDRFVRALNKGAKDLNFSAIPRLCKQFPRYFVSYLDIFCVVCLVKPEAQSTTPTLSPGKFVQYAVVMQNMVS
jgi:hypothetical protein